MFPFTFVFASLVAHVCASLIEKTVEYIPHSMSMTHGTIIMPVRIYVVTATAREALNFRPKQGIEGVAERVVLLLRRRRPS